MRSFKTVRRRTGLRILTILTAVMLIFGQSVFADTAPAPVREVHKVSAGEKMYCFFVQKNVVLTPAQIAAIEDDQALTEDILKRAGLYMRETSCTSADHPVITMEAWLKAGNTVQLSQIDIVKLRQAMPSEGEPVKLHLDLRFTVKEPWEDEVQPQPDDPAVEPGDEPGDDPAVDPPEDPSDNPGDVPGDGSGEGTGDDPAVEPSDNPGGGSGDSAGDDPAVGPSDNPGGGSGDGAGDDPGDEPEKKRQVYSTFKKTSPELLFIVIATDADAAEAEEDCSGQSAVPAEPDEPELPEFPDGMEGFELPEDLSIPEAILPEFRTIKMTDKKGAPLEEVLQDGDPVSLEWIEPKKKIDKSDFEEFLEHIPGGVAGLGAILGIAAAGVGAAVIAVRRKREAEE
ncbi:MAG: hypothetical protein K6B12_00845 [Clostridiales bacterium]|nr:hypothetical protein [Clostridiales bacterium]